MIEDYINNLKVYDNFSFSIEDKIRDLFGEVCFYNGSGRKKGGIMTKEESRFSRQDTILLTPENIKNEKDAVKFAKQAIEYAEYLQGKRSTSPYFRRTHRGDPLNPS